MLSRVEKELDWTLLIKLIKKYHPIAKITKTSGFRGDVCLRPLSRFFDEYITEEDLMVGSTLDSAVKINIEMVYGVGKKRKFKFLGVNSSHSAKKIIGMTIFVKASLDAKINWISKEILGFMVIDEQGYSVGYVNDVMWLPNYDAYIIRDKIKEYIIPIIPEIIEKIDYKNRNIIIKVMDGLLN